MRKFIILSMIALSMLSMCSCGTLTMNDYLSRLVNLEGTSYWTLQCSTYITTAKQFRHCGASEFWDSGCGGALVTVTELPGYGAINPAKLQKGDVIAFHGVHVAVYVGNGQFMDSDPNHGGVGPMTPNALPGDLWFTGRVKILRWKS